MTCSEKLLSSKVSSIQFKTKKFFVLIQTSFDIFFCFSPLHFALIHQKDSSNVRNYTKKHDFFNIIWANYILSSQKDDEIKGK